MTMRVNLIYSKLIFKKNTKNVNLIHYKLIFKKNTKTKHTKKKKKKFTQTVQVNCAVHVNTKFCKAAMSCFAKFTSKT
jgi:hypothetical protein